MGLIIDSTCVPFESISNHRDTFGQMHQVGWIKVISCDESGWTGDPDPFTIHRNDYSSLSSRSISIKFQPPGSSNINYDDFTVIARPYSNPIEYGLNYHHEISYTYDSEGRIVNYVSTENWIGSSVALARLDQICYADTSLGAIAFDFDERIYHACGNEYGLHVIFNRNQTAGYFKCQWDNSQLLGIGIEIYFGFVPEDCDTESPTQIPTYHPSMQPTIYPSIFPSSNPSFNPTVPITNNPSKTLTMSPNNPTLQPSFRPTTTFEGASMKYSLYLIRLISHFAVIIRHQYFLYVHME